MNPTRTRLKLSLLGAALALASGCASAPVAALEAVRVGEHSWYFHGGSGVASQANRGYTSNAGFVVTHEGVVVVDALGTPALAREMLAAIRSVTDQPVRRVVVTHYHADHVYGLQVFQAEGAEIWARSEGQAYLASDLARERLAQRRAELAPWVDDATRVLPADRWIDFKAADSEGFALGGVQFRLVTGGHAHAPDDMMLLVEDDAVLFAGDLYFSGRLPFVVDGNTRGWLAAIERMQAAGAKVVVPGHGEASENVAADLALTGGYLRFLRSELGRAVQDMVPFDEAYERIDWSGYANLPTFEAANRRNAYTVYLELEAEALGAAGGG